jgi:hypothetical protein
MNEFEIALSDGYDRNPSSTEASKYYKMVADEDDEHEIYNYRFCVQDGMGTSNNLNETLKQTIIY